MHINLAKGGSILLLVFLFMGCSTLKPAITGGTSAGLSAVGGAAFGPAGAAIGAASGVIISEIVIDETPVGRRIVEANFWTPVGTLIETTGWVIVLIFLIPMLVGWLIPGPYVGRKKKDDK